MVYSSKMAAQKMLKGNNTYRENTIIKEIPSLEQPKQYLR